MTDTTCHNCPECGRKTRPDGIHDPEGYWIHHHGAEIGLKVLKHLRCSSCGGRIDRRRKFYKNQYRDYPIACDGETQ